MKTVVAVCVVALFFGLAAQPAVAQPNWNSGSGKEPLAREVPAPFRELSGLVARLREANTNNTDSDNDSLPDKIELVIGTDPAKPDSDFDGLNDSAEVNFGVDPLKPDSNDDNYPDYAEVTNISRDLDGDGTPNGWDFDNDNDGVMDGLDLSPNARSTSSLNTTFRLVTGGKPTYINFQLNTKDPRHLQQYSKVWNWPEDKKGTMQDLDSSVDDVTISPILTLESSYLPNQSALESEGIVISENSANIPLIPVMDLGNTVALEGRMFYPGGAPLNISMTLKMSWSVSGLTDKSVSTLKANNNKYVFADKNGTVKANASAITPGTKYEVVQTGDNREYISFKAGNGRFLALGANNVIAATGTQINKSTQFTRTVDGTARILKSLQNGLYVIQRADGTLAAESKTTPREAKFTPADAGYRAESIPLVVYPEEFFFTGLSVEENFGDDIGLFYGGNVTTMVAANLMMAYDFLRNATTKVSDVPGMLSAQGIVVTNKTMTVPTRDGLLSQLGGKPLRDIVATLPAHSSLPVISIFTDRAATVELSGMKTGSYILGNNFTGDVSTKPVVVVKSLKTNWYDTDSDRQLNTTEMLESLKQLGLSKDALLMLASLMMVWNKGENIVVQVGPTAEDFKSPDVSKVTDWVVSIQKYGINVTMNIILAFKIGLTVYAFVKLLAISECLTVLTFAEKVKTIIDCWTWVGTASKFASALKVITNVLIVVGCIIQVALAGVTAWLMMKAYGYSEYGIAIGVTSFILNSAYAIVMALLSIFGGPVGMAIVAVLAIFDFIWYLATGESIVSKAISWLADQFVHRDERTVPSLELIDSAFQLQDKKNNGLDTGDRLTSIIRLKGIITKTSKGSASDLENSYIKPSLSYSDSKGDLTNDVRKEESSSSSSSKKTTVYNISAWAEPASPAVNFPFSTVLSYSYKTYYQVTYVWVYTEKYSDKASKDLEPSTIYFDVMPSTFDGLMGWKALSSRDTDADGLNNTAETSSDPMLNDTDADGLNDKFELDIGTDPRKPDTDADGLNDLTETRLGTNPCWSDTDGDGLSDSVENTGWVTTFIFSGTTVSWHVRSDPTLNDTDGDGLDDPSERTMGDNPCSGDTDGNGIPDKNDNSQNWMSYMATIPIDRWLGGYPNLTPMDIERDSENYFYVLYNSTDSGNIVYDMLKFYPNGDCAGTPHWGGAGLEIKDFEIGTKHMYILGKGILPGNKDGVGVYKMGNDWMAPDGSLQFNISGNSEWKSFTVDEPNNFLYCANYHNGTITQYNLATGKILRNWVPGPNANRYSGKMAIDRNHHLYCADNERGCIYEFTTELDLVRTINGTSSGDRFAGPSDIEISPGGELFVLDGLGHRLMKLDGNLYEYARFGTNGTGRNNLSFPVALAYNGDKLWVADGKATGRVQWITNTVIKTPNKPELFNDTDGDGLTDVAEKAGWNVTVKSGKKTTTYKVTSEPLMIDTDQDRLPDIEERALGTDPRKTDTDGDGLSDYKEWPSGGRSGPYTNATDDDTDGDDLGDGAEETFGSDPDAADSDGDGLSDIVEFETGTDPQANDTDLDGLNDSAEVEFGSSPLWSDTDGDLMIDSIEMEDGADPNSNDTDGDGLMDGYELIYKTDANASDSDLDGLSDGYEVDTYLDPLSNDTDQDGISDFTEILQGTDPASEDSDQDGLSDFADAYTETPVEGVVYLVADNETDTSRFENVFSKSIGVVRISPAEFDESYKSEKNIILAGNPEAANGTAGALIRDVLSDTPDALDAMVTGADEIMVRYGVWTPEQTVILITNPRPVISDIALEIIKKRTTGVSDNSISAHYLNPEKSEALDDLTTIHTTDAAVWTRINQLSSYSVTLTDFSGAPAALTHSNGLSAGECPTGNYLGVGYGFGSGILAEARVQMFYTAADLDRNGDGDANDSGDINASTLALYQYNATTGNWTRLAPTLDWVKEVGLNTTGVTLYGKDYAGYIYANVTYTTLFAIAGKPSTMLPALSSAGSDISLFVEDSFVLNGSSSTGDGPILNYTWTMQYGGAAITRYGPRFTYQPAVPGNYTATLTVTDSLGQKASDTVLVTVKDRPDGNWNLTVGPVKDSTGTPVTAATVKIRIGTDSISALTDGQGFARIVASTAHIGQTVTVTVYKAGYVPVEYPTRITSDRKLETSPGALVRISPGQTGDLVIGPVKNTGGKLLAGATVVVKLDRTFYYAVTDAQGVARLAIPLTGGDAQATISIHKAGYKDASYYTWISAGMVPVTAPAALKSAQTTTPTTQGTPESLMVMSLMVLVLLIAAMVLMFRRPPAGRVKDAASDE